MLAIVFFAPLALAAAILVPVMFIGLFQAIPQASALWWLLGAVATPFVAYGLYCFLGLMWHELRVCIEAGPRSFRYRLAPLEGPSKLGPLRSGEVPYDQIAAVEVRREISPGLFGLSVDALAYSLALAPQEVGQARRKVARTWQILAASLGLVLLAKACSVAMR